MTLDVVMALLRSRVVDRVTPPTLAHRHDLDPARLDEAHALYRGLPDGGRDDAAAMQFLIPGWTVDPKRPCLVR